MKLFVTNTDIAIGNNYPRDAASGLLVLTIVKYANNNQLCSAAASSAVSAKKRKRRDIIGEGETGLPQDLLGAILDIPEK